MKKELSVEFEISVNDMTPIRETVGEFKVSNETFYNDAFNEVQMDILVNESNGEQIFKMKDGKFILEVEDGEGMVEYFHSDILEDLV